MAVFKCRKCGRTPFEHGVTVHRKNPKGEPGIWECEDCDCEGPPAETAELVAAIQSSQHTHH